MPTKTVFLNDIAEELGISRARVRRLARDSDAKLEFKRRDDSPRAALATNAGGERAIRKALAAANASARRAARSSTAAAT